MSTKTKKPSSTPAMKRAVGPGGKRIPKRKPDAAASSTERRRKAALAEINGRLAGGKQDHEVPTAKEVANNAAVDASAKGKKAKAPKTPRKQREAQQPSAAPSAQPPTVPASAAQ